ncbi:hypothetical protein FocnCong_v019917 [Fusarium oxysporum f. sp. conglutinans]|nr:hypothetical protein FocnCong_v019917 [Fusarium oxysporum f. sp. conglutinans]
MASSSPISSTSAQLTAIERLGWDIYSFFRVEYPEKNKTQIGRVRKSYGRREYVCLHCSTRWSNGYTSNAITHAQNRHRQLIQASETSQNSQQSTQPSIHSYIAFQPSDSALRNVFNAQRYIEAIVGLLTRRRVPFSSVTWDEMKSLALACNPAIEDCLITSRDQAMKIINANYGLYASQLRDLIQGSQSMIHISTDLWTSPHRHAMLAVCAQWVDYNYTLRKALLGLPECPFSHSASWILSDIEWIDFNPKRRRIRCIGHIINLSLQSFLLARSKEALTAALNATISDESVEMVDHFAAALAETITQQEEPVLQGKRPKSTAKASQKTGIDEVYTGWQGIPALQKLHNLAAWLRSSSLHSDSWRDAVGLSLGIDNATRWSSCYKVIDNAIRKCQILRSGKRRTVVLALRELVGEHSGENMADVLLHIFDDYGISGRIGYFMADNASSNDACIDLVLKALYPNMSRKHRVRRRLRCFGHIVNLCAQAFIMGKDAAKTCKDLDSAYREGDYSRIRELWKKRGAIGRLHNIVRYRLANLSTDVDEM